MCFGKRTSNTVCLCVFFACAQGTSDLLVACIRKSNILDKRKNSLVPHQEWGGNQVQHSSFFRKQSGHFHSSFLIPHSSFFIFHFYIIRACPSEYSGRAFGTASTKPPPLRLRRELTRTKGGGFVADRECLYPSRIAIQIGCAKCQHHQISKSCQMNKKCFNFTIVNRNPEFYRDQS